MVLQIIAAVLAKKGHKTAAWVLYWIAFVLGILSMMSAYGNLKHARLAYGYRGNSAYLTFSIVLTLVADVVIFLIIYNSGDGAKTIRDDRPREYSLKTIEELVRTHHKKEQFAYFGSDEPASLVESLNVIARYLGGYGDNSLHGAGLLVDNFAFVFEYLRNNPEDEAGAAQALQREYNQGLEDVYVRRLTSYVKNSYFSSSN